ncbi:MAG: MFS transporter, partial [Lachnospiraceae bacterium]|nr:MFS transporter [Lachnospiraceae bacterium]
LWTRESISTIIMVVCVLIPMTYCMPMLPIYIQSMGGDASMAGVIVSVFNFVSMVCRPVSAWVIDNHKKRMIVVFAFICIIAGCFSYQLAIATSVLLVLRGIHAIGYSTGSNAVGVVVANVLPDERRKEGLGYYGFAISGAIAIGPVIALLVMQAGGIKFSFTVCALIALVGLLVLLQLRFKDEAPASKSKFALSNCYEISAIPLTLIMAVAFFAYSGLATFLSVYTMSLGLGNINVYFYLTLAVGMIVAKIASETIFKGKDTTPLLYFSIIAMAVGLFLLSNAVSIGLFLLTALMFGLGFGTLQAGLLTKIMMASAPQRRGASNSTFLSSGDVGMSFGPMVWGMIAGKFGYSTIYSCGAVIMCLNLVLLFIVLRLGNKKASEKQGE